LPAAAACYCRCPRSQHNTLPPLPPSWHLHPLAHSSPKASARYCVRYLRQWAHLRNTPPSTATTR
jgi:hypothetical protein